jgi:hypothetical protein
MRLNVSAGLAASVVVKYHPPRLQLRIGHAYKFTLTEAEAIGLAADLIAGVDALRADQPNHREAPQ